MTPAADIVSRADFGRHEDAMTLIRDKAANALRDRLDTLDEQIAVLCSDLPGDAGVFRWPSMLADELDRLHEERETAQAQLTVLLQVRPQVVT